MKIKIIVLLIMSFFLILTVSPSVSAEILPDWREGGPELYAIVVEKDEFSPGEIGTLKISVWNEGVPLLRGLAPETTTALGIISILDPGDAPIDVLTAGSAISSLQVGQSATITFQIKVRDGARAGEYELPLWFGYKYLKIGYPFLENLELLFEPPFELPFELPFLGEGPFDFTDLDFLNLRERFLDIILPKYWAEEEAGTYIKIKIAGTDFSVTSLEKKGIFVGSTGTVSIGILNTGTQNAYDVEVELTPPEGFTLIDRGAFLGDLRVGAEKTAEFKIEVPEEAIEKEYPLSMTIDYKDEKGVSRQSYLECYMGIDEGPKFEIEWTSPVKKLTPGDKEIVEISIMNVGDTIAEDAVARISLRDPLTTMVDTSYIGTLEPGESAIALFEIEAKDYAVPKDYDAEMRIKYYDEERNAYISKPLTPVIEVSTPKPIPWNVVAAVVILIAVVGFFVISYLRAGRPRLVIMRAQRRRKG